MIHEIQRLLDDYASWLKDKTILREVNDWIEITTPYLDRHNDYLQIYAKREDDGFILTDDGNTIEDLEQSGCKLESPKRQDLLKLTLSGFGVQLHGGNALAIRATQDNFAVRKHNLIQAMLAVNDMFYSHSENLPGDQLQCTVTRARCHLADGETRTRISPLGKRRECAVDGRTGYGLVMISTERGAR